MQFFQMKKSKLNPTKVSRHLTTIAAALACSSSVSAEPLKPDTQYRGPVTLEVAEVGLKFRLPKGWQGVAPSSAEGFVANNSQGTQVILLPTSSPLSEVQNAFRQGSEISPGVFMAPKGQPTQNSDGSLEGEFSIESPTPIIIYAMMKPIQERATVIIAAFCSKTKLLNQRFYT